MDDVNPPSGLNYWRGNSVGENDARRANFVRPEQAWTLLR